MRRKLKSKDGHNKYSSRFKLVQSQFVLNCFLVNLKMFKKKKLKTPISQILSKTQGSDVAHEVCTLLQVWPSSQ